MVGPSFLKPAGGMRRSGQMLFTGHNKLTRAFFGDRAIGAGAFPAALFFELLCSARRG